ncbi:hypothetical protein BU14_0288s0028 [Porphyra umbilicalis]|uniref:Uncharacterized protein n=1 Tax=Porphyra umbilicalis TaxID=2786 RepID=A0A1X6P0T7_PORUM|nr:hypothetical protein BU14_0288s0028 [Porphyra umbilicalis]|eukprot:OSX74474.1 hypothetical protein BU14_0288s0028 [Porphyra umbilicalis]
MEALFFCDRGHWLFSCSPTANMSRRACLVCPAHWRAFPSLLESWWFRPFPAPQSWWCVVLATMEGAMSFDFVPCVVFFFPSMRCLIVFKPLYSSVAYLFIWLVPCAVAYLFIWLVPCAVAYLFIWLVPDALVIFFCAPHCVENGRVASAIGCGGGQILRAAIVVVLSPCPHAVIRGGDLQSALCPLLPPKPRFSFPPPPQGAQTPSSLLSPSHRKGSQRHQCSHSVSGHHLCDIVTS